MIHVSILRPEPGRYVHHQVQLEGTVTGATDETILRVIVVPETLPTYHPQQGRADIDLEACRWSLITYIGNSTFGTHNDEQYRILIVKCNESADTLIEEYIADAMQRQVWPGLSRLPSGCKILAELSVTRNDRKAEELITPLMSKEFDVISAKLLGFELHGIKQEQKELMWRALERLMAEAAEKRDAITAFTLRVQGFQERLKALTPKDSDHQGRPQKLRELIARHFNDSELRSLSFDLHIDYDTLPGESKSDKCRELIAYCERHGQTCKLITELGRQRINVSWSETEI